MLHNDDPIELPYEQEFYTKSKKEMLITFNKVHQIFFNKNNNKKLNISIKCSDVIYKQQDCFFIIKITKENTVFCLELSTNNQVACLSLNAYLKKGDYKILNDEVIKNKLVYKTFLDNSLKTTGVKKSINSRINDIILIFDYATSVLPQDAFLTWLIQWADKDYRKIDSSLNTFAISFIQELLEKDNSYKVETIETGRHWNNIDVWAMVNFEYFIIFEDKKGTKEQSNLLHKYYEITKKHYVNQNIEVKLIYFNMEEQGEHSNIKSTGFSFFKRGRMLEILNEYFEKTELEKQSDIISNYYNNFDKYH
jgi:hypothetical protein